MLSFVNRALFQTNGTVCKGEIDLPYLNRGGQFRLYILYRNYFASVGVGKKCEAILLSFLLVSLVKKRYKMNFPVSIFDYENSYSLLCAVQDNTSHATLNPIDKCDYFYMNVCR